MSLFIVLVGWLIVSPFLPFLVLSGGCWLSLLDIAESFSILLYPSVAFIDIILSCVGTCDTVYFLFPCNLKFIVNFFFQSGLVVMNCFAFALKYPQCELVNFTSHSNLG